MEGRPGFVIAAWCGAPTARPQIKAETQATIRNIPFGSERRPAVRQVRQAGDSERLVREGVLTRSPTLHSCHAAAAVQPASR